MKNMMLSFILMCCVLLPSFIGAEEGFTVTGEIAFKKTGNLYLQMETEQEFKDQKASVRFQLVIKIGEAELHAKKATFAFENVPAGTYAIMVFQDVDGNGELNMGMFGPKEPWGNYRKKRPRFRGPKFSEMAFEVKEDITDIRIEVK